MADFDENKPDDSGGKSDKPKYTLPSHNAPIQPEEGGQDVIIPNEAESSESDSVDTPPPAMPVISRTEGATEEISDSEDDSEEYLEESEDFTNLFDAEENPADAFEEEMLDSAFVDSETTVEADIPDPMEDIPADDESFSEASVEALDEPVITDESPIDETTGIDTSSEDVQVEETVSPAALVSDETTNQTQDTKTGTATPATSSQAKSDNKAGTSTPASNTQAKSDDKTGTTTPATSSQAKSDNKTGTSTPASNSQAKPDNKTGTTTPASNTQAKSDNKTGTTTPASNTQAKSDNKTGTTTPASNSQAKSDNKTGTTTSASSQAKSDTKASTTTPASNTQAKADSKAGTSTPASNTQAKADAKTRTSTPANNTQAKSDNKAGTTTPASNTQAKSDNKTSTTTPATNTQAKSDNKAGTTTPATSSQSKSDNKTGTSTPARNSQTKSDTKAGTTTPASNTQAKSDNKTGTSTPASNTQAKSDNKTSTTTPASNTQAKADSKTGTSTPASNSQAKSDNKTSTSTPASNTQAKSDNKAGTSTPASNSQTKSDAKTGTTPASNTQAKSDNKTGTSTPASNTQAKSDNKAGTSTPASNSQTKSDAKTGTTTPASNTQPKTDTANDSARTQDTKPETTTSDTEIKPPPPPPDAPQSDTERVPETTGATPLATPVQPVSINPQRRQRANAISGQRPNIGVQASTSTTTGTITAATEVVQSIIPTSAGLTPDEIARTPIFWRWGDMFWVISAYVSVVLLQARGFQAPDTTRFIVSLVVSSLFILMALGFLVWAINTYLTRRARGRTQGLALRIFFIVQNSVWLLTLILTIIGLTVESQIPAQVMIYIISLIALIWWGVKLFLRIDNRHLMRSYDYVTNTTVFATMFMTFVFIIIGTGLMNGNGSTRLSIIDPETAYGTLNIIAMTIAIISSLVFLVALIPEQMRYTDTQNRLRRIVEFMGTVAAGNALSVAGLAIGIAVAAVSPDNTIGLTLAANIITIAALSLVPYDALAKIRDARTASGYKEVYLVVMILLLLVITLISMLNFAFALAKDDTTNAVTALVAAGLGIVSIIMEIIQLGIVGDGKERNRDWGKIIGNIFLLVATTMAILSASSTFNQALEDGKLAFAIVALFFFILAFVLKLLAELDLLGVIWRGLGRIWQGIMSRRALPADVTPIDVTIEG